MSRLVLPDVNKVRTCIESVQREDMRNYLKALYLLGAARAYEMTGRICLSQRLWTIF